MIKEFKTATLDTVKIKNKIVKDNKVFSFSNQFTDSIITIKNVELDNNKVVVS